MISVGTALAGLGVALVASFVLWLVSLRLRDASIADPYRGPGFLLIAVTYLVAHGEPTPRGLLVLGLVAAWAARLGLHLTLRNRAHGEDRRYGAMREHHGAGFPVVSLFTVFWLQAALAWVVSMPVFAAVTAAGPLGVWDGLGTAVFVAGFFTEAIADAQLRRFTADPRNRAGVLNTGLWRYSRHPNYFGNAVLWWGLFLVAVGVGGWWTAVGPVLMTFLLARVSGVTLLERTVVNRRPGYREYVRTTSAFVPWFPRTL